MQDVTCNKILRLIICQLSNPGKITIDFKKGQLLNYFPFRQNDEGKNSECVSSSKTRLYFPTEPALPIGEIGDRLGRQPQGRRKKNRKKKMGRPPLKGAEKRGKRPTEKRCNVERECDID